MRASPCAVSDHGLVSLSMHSALTICRPIKTCVKVLGPGNRPPHRGLATGLRRWRPKKSLRDQIRELVSLCPDSEDAARPTTEEKIASVDRAIPEESIA